METIFENDKIRLDLTGHDYDFVGGITVKTTETQTFFFEEELFPQNDEDNWEWDDDEINESKTRLIDVQTGLHLYEGDEEDYYSDEWEAERNGATSWITRSASDGWGGFLSDPKQRGWFLALVKNYCPEQLKNIPWA